MRSTRGWLAVTVMTAVVGMFLAGCATAPAGSPGVSQTDLLKQSGFMAHTPANSQNLAYVKTLPAKKVVSNQYQGQVLYLVCTDPDAKQCYLGDKAAYDRYQQLAIQQSISADQHQVSEQRWDPQALQMWVDAHGGG